MSNSYTHHEINAMKTFILKNNGIVWSNLVETCLILGSKNITDILSTTTSEAEQWLKLNIWVLNSHNGRDKTKTLPLSGDLKTVVTRQLRLAKSLKCNYLFSAKTTWANRANEDKPITRQTTWTRFKEAVVSLPETSISEKPKSMLGNTMSNADFEETLNKLLRLYGDKLSAETVKLLRLDLKRTAK